MSKKKSEINEGAIATRENLDATKSSIEIKITPDQLDAKAEAANFNPQNINQPETEPTAQAATPISSATSPFFIVTPEGKVKEMARYPVFTSEIRVIEGQIQKFINSTTDNVGVFITRFIELNSAYENIAASNDASIRKRE